MNGKFIVIEGLDGAGKTSAISDVIETLKEQSIQDIVLTHEPGGTPIADELRTLIKDRKHDEPVTDYAELLMFYAARAQLVEGVIRPALTRGTWVIADRHELSSQAYQGGGRGINQHLLQILHDLTLKELHPDLTLYLDVPPALGLARVRNRAQKKLDRIEAESLAFFERIYARYQTLITDDHVIKIDASQPHLTVKTMIRKKVKKWLYAQTLHM